MKSHVLISDKFFLKIIYKLQVFSNMAQKPYFAQTMDKSTYFEFEKTRFKL